MTSLLKGLAVVVILSACTATSAETSTTAGDAPSTTATTSLPTTIANAPSTSTSMSTLPPTTVDPDSTWPVDGGPDKFAVISDTQIQPIGFGDDKVLEIPDTRTGVIVGDDLLLGLNRASGVWLWPPSSEENTTTPSGQEPLELLVGQAGTETATWFYDASLVGNNPLVLYGEIESETEPIEQRMMLYDISDGQHTELWDKATRRDDLGGDELTYAPIGDAAIHSDGFAALFAFGDSTWIEWYDLGGNPETSPAGVDSVEGTVLELAIAEDKIVLGVETEFPRLITHLWVVDLATGEVSDPLIHDVEGQSLNRIAFDGQWVTATIIDSAGDPVGSFYADVDNNTTEVSDQPVSVALARG